MSLDEARKHLKLASEQLDSAAVDSWSPEEPGSCVTNAFYAYENLIVSIAEAHGIDWQKNHYRKADLAEQLASQGLVSRDIKTDLLRMNDLRKDVSYGEAGEELSSANLEDIVVDLENFFEEIQTRIRELEEKINGE